MNAFFSRINRAWPFIQQNLFGFLLIGGIVVCVAGSIAMFAGAFGKVEASMAAVDRCGRIVEASEFSNNGAGGAEQRAVPNQDCQSQRFSMALWYFWPRTRR